MKILVIGGGSIGHRYAAYAQDLTGNAGLFDLDPEKVARFEKGHGGKGFIDFAVAMDWKPQAVIIATPHKTHISLASKVIEAGLPVLIEKPVSHDLKEAKNFLALLKKKQGRAWTVSNMRFHPAIKILSEYLGQIGTVYFARAHFGNWLPNMRPDGDYKKLYCAHKEQGGGMIMDGIHEIDYLMWLFGSCRSVSAIAEKRSDLEIDVEDYASMIFAHKNGVMSEIHMDYLQQYKRRGCEIVGREGTLLWTSEGKNPESCHVRVCTREKGWQGLYANENLDLAEMYREMIGAFIHAIKTGNSGPLATAAEGVAALEAAFGAYESDKKRKQVSIA